MRPAFTILVGSAGRPTLPQLIESFLNQERTPDDHLVIVIDSHEKSDEELSRLRDLCDQTAEGDPSVLCCEYNSGYHFYGVEQVNAAIRSVLPGLLCTHVFTNGDDDVYTKDAFKILRPICEEFPLTPILFQFISPWRSVLWDLPRLRMSHISGCCIAAPKAFASPMKTQTTWPGTSRPYVEHDYEWIEEIVHKSSVQPYWLEKILVIARPDIHTGYGAASAPKEMIV